MATHKTAKRKGTRFEQNIVKMHKELGIRAERQPMSGAIEGLKGDVKVYLDMTKFHGECKHHAKGFATLYNFIADNDLLFLKRDHDSPLICMTQEMYKYLITRSGPE